MKILVTGASGNIGRKVIDHLIAAGADDIRALANHPDRADLPPEVEVVRGYLGRVSSLPAAFEGVDRMYLAPHLPTAAEVVQIARAAGIGRIVDLSGDESNHWWPIAEAVQNSGLDWTHLFAGEFMENSTQWADQIRATGEVREPYPDSANTPIAMDDIARVAATVLLQDGHSHTSYTLTGPETITRATQLHHLAQALDRPLTFTTIPHDEAIAQLTPHMGDFATWYVDGLRMMVDHPLQPTTTVPDLTGYPGTTFAQWANANAHQFR
ncbi:NAD(P)H-binding protein [Nocardia terpenica]|uniref:SDR family oxidoreductase n=1 Tax=Nocardia terpenica TaxID=455432 RepID=UPI002FDFE507